MCRMGAPLFFCLMNNVNRGKALDLMLKESNPQWSELALHKTSDSRPKDGMLSLLLNAAGDDEIMYAHASIGDWKANDYTAFAFTKEVVIVAHRTGPAFGQVHATIYPRQALVSIKLEGGKAVSIDDDETTYSTPLSVTLDYGNENTIGMTDRSGELRKFLPTLRADLLR